MSTTENQNRHSLLWIVVVVLLLTGLPIAVWADLRALSREALFSRAIAHGKLGDYAAAERDCTRLLEIEPRHAPAYGLRGFVVWSLGRTTAALADLDEALRLDPSLRPARLNRADLLAQLGDLERARGAHLGVVFRPGGNALGRGNHQAPLRQCAMHGYPSS